MKNIVKTNTSEKTKISFESEWLYHKKGSEWWYCTGYLTDENNDLYSYQFTLVKPHIAVFKPFVLMLALTNFKTKKHYYVQKIFLSKSKIIINEKQVGVKDIVLFEKSKNGFKLKVNCDSFSCDLDLTAVKSPVWHCDNGILKMGSNKTEEETYYYSYTNLKTSGTITENNKSTVVKGKTWFDKQGGSFRLLKGRTHWEWFSLRFFDNEEIMLFAFPQNNYKDGTVIYKDGKYKRLTNYQITPTKFTTANDMKFSCEWIISIPDIKEKEYRIVPIMDGQLNIGYFELLAEVINKDNEKVGMCFVELLPGVYNKEFKIRLFEKQNK
mgnify:CR=1 FL=1